MKPSSLDLMWAKAQHRALSGATDIMHPTTFVPDVETNAEQRSRQGSRRGSSNSPGYVPGLRPRSVDEFAAVLSERASGRAGARGALAASQAEQITSDFQRYAEYRAKGGGA